MKQRRRMNFGLLGERLTHSFSPLIHAELGDYEYCLYEKKPHELDSFLRYAGFDGLNVTIPYKKTVVPYCRELSETAKLSGSVNTVTRLKDGSLYGDNTDFFGFSYLLEKTGINPADGKSIILGSGGSSQTAQTVLEKMKAREIVVISRSGKSCENAERSLKCIDNYNNIEKHSDARIIINTTPVGMYPNNGISPISDFGIFQNCRAVIDLIYNPSRTELMQQAQERGVLCRNGLAMLAAQAKKSAEIFTNSSIADEKIEEIISKIIKMTRNIVLIGMPGSGKTSIGKALAKKTGRKFADTDDLIVETRGISIPEIFARDGEKIFRKLESEALKTLCKNSGFIIATGGGIVKRLENLRVIRQNGIVVFLDRDISLLPVAGRPLSQKEGINALVLERMPAYKSWSEYQIKVHGVEETAEDILKNLL